MSKPQTPTPERQHARAASKATPRSPGGAAQGGAQRDKRVAQSAAQSLKRAAQGDAVKQSLKLSLKQSPSKSRSCKPRRRRKFPQLAGNPKLMAKCRALLADPDRDLHLYVYRLAEGRLVKPVLLHTYPSPGVFSHLRSRYGPDSYCLFIRRSAKLLLVARFGLRSEP